MKSFVVPAVRLLLILTIITGVAYPLAMTVFASIVFGEHANGSMIVRGGSPVGSELIGQKFSQSGYFHSRPSAVDYNPLPSSGTNFAPTSAAMRDSVHARRNQFSAENGLPSGIVIPNEMLFASASGLDPHISPGAAVLQIGRVARARGFDNHARAALAFLVERYTEGPELGFLGQPRVNVLRLNLALDELQQMK